MRSNAKEPSPLAGFIVDAKGNRLTPSHTVKAGRRYRYYVDNALIAGEKLDGERLRRIPASEIESIVRNELANLFSEPSRLLNALGGPSNATETDNAIRQARTLSQGLREASPSVLAEQVRPILQQVVIGDEFVRLRIMRDGLRAALSLSPRTGEAPSDSVDGREDELHDIDVPARVRMRGGQIKLIVGRQGDHARREGDIALIKAVARAHLWFDRLKNGDAPSVRQIARGEGVTGSYVSQVLKLTFLAPDIVEAILDGQHPVDLTAERLLVHEDLPSDWREQRRKLSFDPG